MINLSDIITVTKEVIDIFTKHDLTRAQSMFVLKACEMNINEEIIRETVDDARKGKVTDSAGIF